MSNEVTNIDPENPKRLRDIIDQLSQLSGLSVLRVEMQWVPDSDRPEEASMRMIVTHSLGPKREQELAPLLGAAFYTALKGVAEKDRTSDSEGERHG